MPPLMSRLKMVRAYSTTVWATGSSTKKVRRCSSANTAEIKWAPGSTDEKAWGYGNGPRTEEEYISRYKGLTDALLDNPRMFGFCYTQLTDVEQEQNGIYYYDRTPKIDVNIFKEINSRKAAIED